MSKKPVKKHQKKDKKDLIFNIVLVSILSVIFITLLTVFIIKIKDANTPKGTYYSQDESDWATDTSKPPLPQ